METLIAALLTVVLQLPAPWFPEDHRPETEDQRAARIERIVAEVVRQVDDVREGTGYTAAELASLSLVQMYNEGALAYEVHAGVTWPGRPPPFGDHGLAKCLFQLQPSAASVPVQRWRPFEPGRLDELVGLGELPTRRCVRAGVRAIAWQIARCRNIRDAHAKGDARWAATLVFSQVRLPTASCSGLTAGSTRRAYAYETFLARVRRELASGAVTPQPRQPLDR